jgi:hypothetical protein
MRISTHGRRRIARQATSKGHRPSNSVSTPGREVEATTVRVQSLSIRQIKLNQHNSRTHSAKQIRQIANTAR